MSRGCDFCLSQAKEIKTEIEQAIIVFRDLAKFEDDGVNEIEDIMMDQKSSMITMWDILYDTQESYKDRLLTLIANIQGMQEHYLQSLVRARECKIAHEIC